MALGEAGTLAVGHPASAFPVSHSHAGTGCEQKPSAPPGLPALFRGFRGMPILPPDPRTGAGPSGPSGRVLIPPGPAPDAVRRGEQALFIAGRLPRLAAAGGGQPGAAGGGRTVIQATWPWRRG